MFNNINNSQDIFLMLLLTMFMGNENSDYQNINSTLLALMLFGTFENRTQSAILETANSPRLNATAYQTAYNTGLYEQNARVNRTACNCRR